MSAIRIVIDVLKAAAAVIALTGKQGLYPVQAPQPVQGRGPAAFCVVNLAGGRDAQTLVGAARYYEHRVSVECIAADGTIAVNLGDAVLTALESVVKQTVSTATDVDVWFADLDVTDPADQQAMARRTLHFYVRFKPV